MAMCIIEVKREKKTLVHSAISRLTCCILHMLDSISRHGNNSFWSNREGMEIISEKARSARWPDLPIRFSRRRTESNEDERMAPIPRRKATTNIQSLSKPSEVSQEMIAERAAPSCSNPSHSYAFFDWAASLANYFINWVKWREERPKRNKQTKRRKTQEEVIGDAVAELFRTDESAVSLSTPLLDSIEISSPKPTLGQLEEIFRRISHWGIW